MNVTVENLAPCKKLIRIELPATAVDEAFEAMTKNYLKQAALPGFRPGKAPREMVLKKYGADISDEVKKKLLPDAYHNAIKEQKIDVVGYPDIEEIQFGRGQSLQFAATVETAPEIELPDYKGLPAKREQLTVTDEDVTKALTMLRERQTDFKVVARATTKADVTVVNYSGTAEGKPLTDFAPTARGLTTKQGYWVNMDGTGFIPGFADQLLGAQAGDKRTVTVSFEDNLVQKELVGKTGVYEVEVVEVREKVLPELNDAFAKTLGAENLDKLQTGVRTDLENELNSKNTRSVRNQIVEALLAKAKFDLPEAIVANETRSVVYDIVRENQQRGVTPEIIEKEKEKIYSSAADGAKNRVKASFLFNKIAEKESIQVTQDELLNRISHLAQMSQTTPDKLIKDLQKRNGINQLAEQIRNEKVVDFLQQHAALEDAKPVAA
ncbi:MAG: hypothetical protein RLZZ350_2541 [Verrucomicrobiota bacterium]